MRKTATYVVQDEGRDKGKTFVITEMSAAKTERWAMRAFTVLMRHNVDVGEVRANGGIEEIARAGFGALTTLKFDEVEDLLDEMFDCVVIVPDPKKPEITRPIIEDDIEEVLTRLKIREAVFKLHTDFLQGGVPSKPSTSRRPSRG